LRGLYDRIKHEPLISMKPASELQRQTAAGFAAVMLI